MGNLKSYSFKITSNKITLILILLLLNSFSSFYAQDSFESDFDGWIQVSGDDFNWERESGETPSNQTGPDSADSGNIYIYAEASNPRDEGDKTWIQKPFDLTAKENASLSFKYHMDGRDMGTLNVWVSPRNNPNYSKLFTVSGDQGNDWLTGTVDLSDYSNQEIIIRFEAIIGDGYRSDIALDTIEVTSDDIINTDIDTDGDGVIDSVDLDDDNDGILDTVENPFFTVTTVDAYWTLDNTTNDVSGNGNNERSGDGNTPPFSTDAIQGSHSANFNGGNDRIRYSQDGDFMESTYTNISFSAWIKPSNLSGNRTIYEEGGGTHGSILWLNNGVLTYSTRNSGNQTDITHPTTLTIDNIWHHVAATYNSGVMTVYLDGIPATTSTSTTEIPNHSSDGGIGGSFGGDSSGVSTSGFAGLIDAVRYSKTITWSEDDIKLEASLDLDNDSDGIQNSLDLDSDNDGIPDNIEAQSTIGYVAPNGVYDADGVDTAYTGGLSVIDTDSDNIADYLDTDSDNDGVLDTTEAGLTLTAVVGNNGLDNAYDNEDNYLDVNGSFDNTQTDNFPDEDDDVSKSGGDVDYRDDSIDVVDTDGDTISDDVDLDDDNDGILDVIENGECTIADKEEILVLFSEDFGTGNTRTTNSNVKNHNYTASGAIPDGDYAVISSNSGDGLAQYNRTDLNGDLDANIDQFSGPEGGSTNGRYLSINMINQGNTEFYRQSLTDLIIGGTYRFRLDLAGLCNNCDDLPIFRLEIQDTSGTVLQSISSSSIGVANNDLWKRVALNFVATTDALDVVIINDQPKGSAGNDVGVDNIVFGLLQCKYTLNDIDGDGVINSLDLDSDNDGIPDNIEAQSTIDYLAPNGVYDAKGIDTAYTGGLSVIDTDEDTLPDYLDLDSDADGVFDVLESGENLPNDGNGKSTGTFGVNGLNNLVETGSIDLGYTDINGKYDNTQTDNFTDTDNDVLTIGDVDYRDKTLDGVPIITQVYHYGSEKWIEITNIHETRTIAANNIKIQLYKNKTGDQTDVTPDAVYIVNSALDPGQSVLFKNSANTITNINDAAIIITNNALTDIAGTNDIITLSRTNDDNSYKYRYEIVEDLTDNTSFVRIDAITEPNKAFTAVEWISFVDDNLNPYRLLAAGGAQRHVHDPLISEVNTANIDASILLGLHRIYPTYRTGNTWSNGYPDRSRHVVIDEDYNHTNNTLSARRFRVNRDRKFSITDNLLLVTNDIVLNGEIRLVNPSKNGAAQLIQTHQGASLVTGTTGKLLVDQNSTVPSKYRFNYMGSPVTSSTGSTTYTVGDVLKDGTNPTNVSGVINGSGTSGIAKDINWIGGFDGNFEGSPNNPISLANYWIYTYAANESKRAAWEQKFSSGTIENTDGFIMKGPGREQNYTFVGVPKDGNITTTIGSKESYLLANPYSSTISVKKFIEDNINSISGTLYFWEHAGEKSSGNGNSSGHNYSGYVGGYAARTLAIGVNAKNAARGPINTILEAESALISGGAKVENSSIDQTKADVILAGMNQSVTFQNIPGAIDTLRIRYNTIQEKQLRIKINSNTIKDYELNRTGQHNYEVIEIAICIESGSDITLESIDATPFKLDCINLKDDDGEVACAPSVGGSDITYKEPKPYIAVGQGFFVQGGTSNGGTITFNNSQREYVLEGEDAVFFKTNKKTDANSISKLPLIKLGMDFNSIENSKLFHRQIGISFSQYNSFNYDKGYDSEIYDIGNTDFYWKFPNDDNKYVIAGVEDISENLEVPLEIIMGTNGYVSFNIDEIKNIERLVYILDKVTGKSYEIINNKVTFALDQGKYSDRFFLAFKSTNTTLTIQEEDYLNSFTKIHVDNKNKLLVISKEKDIKINKVQVYSILGRKIYDWQLKNEKQTIQLSLNKELPTNIYFVKLKTSNGEFSKKIILNN
ncbi:LamG-like jellyroll fold domain-containing protein [Polaribacter sp.]|uniref:LamG-like jellyroll fold domain-containing protein n=1 Tax=Polaribacter sp. TaxID=1920175 RepID=UPI003F6AE8EC